MREVSNSTITMPSISACARLAHTSSVAFGCQQCRALPAYVSKRMCLEPDRPDKQHWHSCLFAVTEHTWRVVSVRAAASPAPILEHARQQR